MSDLAQTILSDRRVMDCNIHVELCPALVGCTLWMAGVYRDVQKNHLYKDTIWLSKKIEKALLQTIYGGHLKVENPSIDIKLKVRDVYQVACCVYLWLAAPANRPANVDEVNEKHIDAYDAYKRLVELMDKQGYDLTAIFPLKVVNHG